MASFLLPLIIGGGMTALGAIGQRNAQRAALRRQRELELDALRRERMAGEIRDRAAREAHAERSAGRQALLDELPAFAGDAKAQQRGIADLLGQAAEAGRALDAFEAGAAPAPDAPAPDAAAGMDAYAKAQKVVRAKVDARARQMEALRRATELPAAAALGTGRRLRGLADVLGGAAGDARLAADLGASEAMPWETGARLARGWGAQVRPNPSLFTSLMSGLGPTVMGYGMGQGLAGMMGGGAGTGMAGMMGGGQPPAPVTDLSRWAPGVRGPRFDYPRTFG